MKTSLNLMTDECRRTQFLRESKQFWSRTFALSLLALAVVGACQWWQGRATSWQLYQLEQRYAPIQALKNECIRMRTEINAMRDAQQLTLRLVDTRPAVTLLGAVSTAAAETSGDIFVEQLELEHGEGMNHDRKAIMIGIGKDNSAIARFAAALRASELFADVALNSSDSSQLADEASRSFRIECRL